MARDSWTDAPLGDLNQRVDSGFSEVSREFQAVRLEMRSEFAAVRSEMATEFAAVRTELTEMRGEMAALNRTLIQIAFGAAVTLVVGLGGTIATVLTQT